MLETVIDKKNKIWHVYADNSVVIEIRTSGILHILFRTFFHFSQSPPLPLSPSQFPLFKKIILK
jgi:hypothetical protein